jgi:hypothetical protein
MSSSRSRSHVPAERGWHVVTIGRGGGGTLCIFKIDRITHWDARFDHPMQDGKSLFFDPDNVNLVSYVSYLMDPQGRLLGRDREVVANSVVDLQEQHMRWRAGHLRQAPPPPSDAGSTLTARLPSSSSISSF